MGIVEVFFKCLMRVTVAAIFGAVAALAVFMLENQRPAKFNESNPRLSGTAALPHPQARRSTPLTGEAARGHSNADEPRLTALWAEIGSRLQSGSNVGTELRSGYVNVTRGTRLRIAWAANPDQTIVLDSVDPFSNQITRTKYVNGQGSDQITVDQSALFLMRESKDGHLSTRATLEVIAGQ